MCTDDGNSWSENSVKSLCCCAVAEAVSLLLLVHVHVYPTWENSCVPHGSAVIWCSHLDPSFFVQVCLYIDNIVWISDSVDPQIQHDDRPTIPYSLSYTSIMTVMDTTHSLRVPLEVSLLWHLNTRTTITILVPAMISTTSTATTPPPVTTAVTSLWELSGSGISVSELV